VKGLEVRGVSFAYAGGASVLQEVSFRTRPGALLAVLGPNGAGKSTLFRCILGLLSGYSGDVLLDGAPLRRISTAVLARKAAYVPQSHQPSFNYSVFDMVLMGTTAQIGRMSAPGPRQAALAVEALERLGIAHLQRRGYTQISGGERQLVLIARALAQQAALIIMDEPTANLDYGNQMLVLSQIKALTRAGYSVIQSTHSPDHAFMFADEVITLQQGRVTAAGPPAEALTAERIKELYGVNVRVRRDERGVCACTPVLDDPPCVAEKNLPEIKED
jgi:iron complex transport system ATP-binding protein